MHLLALATFLAASLTDFVNPFIGTTNFGATNPGAVVPNGMMSVTPFNVTGSDMNTWDKDSRWWSTPYTSDNKYFTGFSHVNLSGVGCPEAGVVLTMPTKGPVNPDLHFYGSEIAEEVARPGYYKASLPGYGIKVEASATKRSSIERYTFPAGEGNILINLGEGLTNETGAWVRRLGPGEYEGMRFAGTFCYNSQAVFPIYFYIRVSKKPDKEGFWKKQRPMTAEASWDSDQGKYKIYNKYDKEIAGDDIGCWMSFADLGEGEVVCLEMGISFVSPENAKMNLEAEQKGFKAAALSNNCGVSQPVLIVADRAYAAKYPQRIEAFLKMYFRAVGMLHATPPEQLATDYIRFFKEWTGLELTPDQAVRDIKAHPVFTLSEQLALFDARQGKSKLQTWLGDIAAFYESIGALRPADLPRLERMNAVTDVYLKAISPKP